MQSRLLFILLCLLCCGCSNIHQVTGKTFENEALPRMRKTSVNHYIGEADGKLFVLVKRHRFIGNGSDEHIYFTPKSALTPEFLKQLEHGKKERIP